MPGDRRGAAEMTEYRRFYELHSRPFGKHPEGRPFFYSQLEDLTEHLRVVAEEGGAGMVSGEVGIGKTTAVRHFLGGLDQSQYHVCYIGSTRHPRGILRALVESFGVPSPYLKSDMLSQAARLIGRTFLEQRRRTVFALDEAHLAADAFLEDLRLLTNFEMDSRDPMALLLVGHPSLRARLRQPIHAALADRLNFHYRLEGFSATETLHYIEEHMAQAGASPGVFSPEAARAIFEYAQGAPRRINRLALACLAQGALKEIRPITAELVSVAASSMESF